MNAQHFNIQLLYLPRQFDAFLNFNETPYLFWWLWVYWSNVFIAAWITLLKWPSFYTSCSCADYGSATILITVAIFFKFDFYCQNRPRQICLATVVLIVRSQINLCAKSYYHKCLHRQGYWMLLNWLTWEYKDMFPMSTLSANCSRILYKCWIYISRRIMTQRTVECCCY